MVAVCFARSRLTIAAFLVIRGRGLYSVALPRRYAHLGAEDRVRPTQALSSYISHNTTPVYSYFSVVSRDTFLCGGYAQV